MNAAKLKLAEDAQQKWHRTHFYVVLAQRALSRMRCEPTPNTAGTKMVEAAPASLRLVEDVVADGALAVFVEALAVRVHQEGGIHEVLLCHGKLYNNLGLLFEPPNQLNS